MSADLARSAAPATGRVAVWLHGAGLGVCVGLFAALVEHLRLLVGGSMSADAMAGYWEIAVPHLILGGGAGLVAGVLVSLRRGRPRPLAADQALIFSVLLAMTGWAYAAVTTAYWLGPPALGLANLVAVLIWAVALAIAGLLFHRVAAVAFGALERRSALALRMAAPIAALMLVVIPLTLMAAGFLLPSRAKAVEAGGAGTDGGRPNILLVVIDATRADHIPLYGYSRQTTPRLSALAREGVTFTRMYAQATSTRPSIATLFSSLYPAVHKVNYERDFLPYSLPVMAEVLRQAGYRTFGVSSNANVSPTFGYAQGFEEFRVWKTESRFRLTVAGRAAEDVLGPAWLGQLLNEQSQVVPRADVITDLTLEWAARTAAAAQPAFMYVHYIDPHAPYRPPAPFDAAFDHRKDRPRRAGDDPRTVVAAGHDVETVASLLDQYDGEILYADRELSRLLDGLEPMGLLRNTIVVVTSDHGEEFYDHGNDSHGRSAYEEVLRVPFVLAWPQRVAGNRTHDGFAGLIDVMPTLLELVGVGAPDGLQGRSVAACLTSSCPGDDDRPLFAQVVQDTFALEATRMGRYKLVRHTRGPRTGEQELYDLVDDPLERRNLASTRRDLATLLDARLDAFNDTASLLGRRIPPERVRTIDAATRRALESLGYLK